ncbi:hypothetical protein [Haloquadratum walsbyi]|jgi:Uncharacterized protein conserved in archaea|nr:hypothetical protein [Haloquadratum walsbyi]
MILFIFVSAAVLPGAIAERDSDIREGVIRLNQDVAVEPLTVNGQSVTLSLDIRLSHRGGASENISVEVRAIDADSNLLRNTERLFLGSIRGDQEVPVRANLTVPREGQYRFDVRIYKSGQRIENGATTVSGVSALTPAYAESTVRFEQFETAAIPPITYRIANVTGNQVRITTTTYLTNTGDTATDEIQLRIMARQADSNIVADQTTATVGTVRSGRTTEVNATLELPDEYNYMLDAMLIRDSVILETTSATAELAPTEPLPANSTREQIDIQASEFETGAETSEEARGETAELTESETSQPGFGVGIGLLTLFITIIVWRRTNE